LLDVFVVAGKPEFEKDTFALVDLLRQNEIPADMDFGRGRAVKKQFDQANKLGARFVLVLGEEEMRNGTVGVKNMATGDQISVLKDKIIQQMKDLL
jgi:histidyl-tRNA synthetase